MSDGQALLRAILDDPDDDAPRLIYADWLEENGDAARAAFIRAQITLARLPQDDSDRDRLVQTERTLWKANRDAWKAWVPAWAKVTEFNRGFVERIQCSAADFIARADEVRAHTPLLSLRVDSTREMAVPLFRSRALDGLRTLRIAVRVDRGDWQHLGECPYLGRLTTLVFNSNLYPDELVSALIRSSALPALQSLRVAWFTLGDELTARLVGSRWTARLHSLDLGHNGISTNGAKAIIDSPHLETIGRLSLRGNPLGADRLTVETLRKRFGERVKV
jgi:uncharacterized protein (TIGR02996 family)